MRVPTFTRTFPLAALVLVALARPAVAQDAPLELRAGYILTEFGQHVDIFPSGWLPAGFAVGVARDWRDSKWGRLGLVGQASAAFGSVVDGESDQFYAFQGGFRLTRATTASGLTPFGEFLLGITRHRVSVEQFDESFSDTGYGGQLAAGIMKPIGDPAKARKLAVRGAFAAYASDGGGIRTFEVGVFVAMPIGN
jgi:hypothetical protein